MVKDGISAARPITDDRLPGAGADPVWILRGGRSGCLSTRSLPRDDEEYAPSHASANSHIAYVLTAPAGLVVTEN